MTLQEEEAEVAFRPERVRSDFPALQAFDAALDNLKRGEPMISNSKRTDLAVGFSPAGSHAWHRYEKCRNAWRMVGVRAVNLKAPDEWHAQLEKANEADAELRDALRELK